MQAVAEASEDPKIRAQMRDLIRNVHGFVADVMRRSQDDGGIASDRDADAEAWICLGVGLIAAAGLRLGGIVEDDLGKIRDSRRRWLTGKTS